MSTLEVNKIIPRTGTTLTLGDSSDKIKIEGAKYLVADISSYTYDTLTNTTSAVAYLDIAGGNTISWTPTSTSDVFMITGNVAVQVVNNNHGVGLGVMRATSSSITSSDSKVFIGGEYQLYHGTSGDNFRDQLQVAVEETNLTVGTTYYYEIYGLTHGSGGQHYFNITPSGSSTTANARHQLQGIHYKYIGT